jgi:hypothetical protein
VARLEETLIKDFTGGDEISGPLPTRKFAATAEDGQADPSWGGAHGRRSRLGRLPGLGGSVGAVSSSNG